MKYARIICVGLSILFLSFTSFADEDVKPLKEKTEKKENGSETGAKDTQVKPVKPAPKAPGETGGKKSHPEKLKTFPKHILFLDAKKTIKVDLKNKILEIPAKVELTSSLIEVALCYTGAPSNRAHESAFVTKSKPSLVHAGLNLIGLKEGKAVEFEGQNKFPTGDGVYVYVKWMDKKTKKEKVFRLEKLIYNNLSQEPVDDIFWIFGGGNMVRVKGKKDYYEADEEGTIICTWHHPASVLDIPLPEGSDDTVFSSYKKNMPPKGTEVTFVFSPKELEKKKDDKKGTNSGNDNKSMNDPVPEKKTEAKDAPVEVKENSVK